jgi:hypothetical protein
MGQIGVQALQSAANTYGSVGQMYQNYALTQQELKQQYALTTGKNEATSSGMIYNPYSSTP